jgi:hypothetical protein
MGSIGSRPQRNASANTGDVQAENFHAGWLSSSAIYQRGKIGGILMTALDVLQLQAMKITNDCKMSNPFALLLNSVATISTDRVADVDIASPDTWLFLANPVYHCSSAVSSTSRLTYREWGTQ